MVRVSCWNRCTPSSCPKGGSPGGGEAGRKLFRSARQAGGGGGPPPAVPRTQRAGPPVGPVARQRRQERRLVREVVEHRAFADVGAAGDLVHGGGLAALFQEQMDGRLVDSSAGFGLLALPAGGSRGGGSGVYHMASGRS